MFLGVCEHELCMPPDKMECRAHREIPSLCYNAAPLLISGQQGCLPASRFVHS